MNHFNNEYILMIYLEDLVIIEINNGVDLLPFKLNSMYYLRINELFIINICKLNFL